MHTLAATATLGEGTTLGHYCVIEEDVSIGAHCSIGHHVVIHAGTRIGDGVRIDDHAVIGKQPMRARNSAVTRDHRPPPAVIGAGCLIGTHAVIYAGCRLAEHVLVADFASIREDVTVGERTIIGRGVAVENACRIGRRCKLETNAYLTAYSELEDFVFVAPGVLTSNDNFIGRTEERFRHFKGVTVRRGGRLGVGAVILPGRTVGPDAVVAAGAVLTRDADAALIQAGVPARPLRAVPPEQLLDAQGWD
ncbi:UDP-3-O-(3-hydroxymyristoyl)glucosamine N-acyltransferase [Rhodothermaceae bacterium RA]|nr:UDP-3-O-(3-hydroxymyristoyl)glucosamine N-acyltransferase [Rhodothermaceae bacterium RA]